ncbi:hypothetical protein JTW50_004756 [Escherichia coli]|nr:hypothetical protein [Escherichia coli]ELT2924897.1 hypothetical protein [Escherichia coli]
MMRKILRTTLITTILFSPIVHAEWYTVTDDDLFSDSHTALMVGKKTSNPEEIDNHMIALDCTPRSLTFSFVEKNIEKETSAPIHSFPIEVAIKIDKNSIIKLNTTYLRRNSILTQAISERTDTEMQKIKIILKQLRDAKHRVKVGIRRQDDTREDAMTYSFNFNVLGSTSAVNKFITACGIKL